MENEANKKDEWVQPGWETCEPENPLKKDDKLNMIADLDTEIRHLQERCKEAYAWGQGNINALEKTRQKLEQEKLEMARYFLQIFLNDKTQYNYQGKDRQNRMGIVPTGKGSRWQTPAEIAQFALKRLGYDSPFDVQAWPDVPKETHEKTENETV